jgi:hypothetical protein
MEYNAENPAPHIFVSSSQQQRQFRVDNLIGQHADRSEFNGWKAGIYTCKMR